MTKIVFFVVHAILLIRGESDLNANNTTTPGNGTQVDQGLDSLQSEFNQTTEETEVHPSNMTLQGLTNKISQLNVTKSEKNAILLGLKDLCNKEDRLPSPHIEYQKLDEHFQAMKENLGKIQNIFEKMQKKPRLLL